MIKNGKPYTCEKGHEDYELISDGEKPQHMPKELFEQRVFEWIDEFVSPSKRTLTNASSYSLKHRLANWYKSTGLYLTNNQFKDAMMIKGYMPVNSDELNWQYKIKVATVSVESSLLQRKLLPEQNEVLKNFVLANFPDAIVGRKSNKTNAYHYIGVGIGWYLCQSKNQIVIIVWPHEKDGYLDESWFKSCGLPKHSKTIRLALVKGGK